MVKTETCCFCDSMQTHRFKLSQPAGHGAFAPRVWSRVVPIVGTPGIPDAPGPAAGCEGAKPIDLSEGE
jgi:hypothetical protein